MNGRTLTLGIVAGLAVAGLARQRGGRNHLPTLYHVTTREASDDILRNGFLPGWGDIGLGVYFYGSEREAMRYAQKGGWDGALRGEHVVVLAVRDPHIRRMGDADLDLSWDRSRYADMWFWEERNEDAYMVPSSVSVASDLGIVGANRGARKGSASLNLRGGRNTEALRSDLLPAALRDTHDLVVTEIQKRTSHWEPTGVEKGVTSVPYTYHTLVAVLYPKGERQKESRLGQVAATSERKRETPTPLRGRCAADLVQLGGPDYAFGVTGAFVDERLRGKGVGQALYAALVEAAGAHGGALTSNRCLTGTELTSADALRVWERLGRRYAVEGEVAWHRVGSNNTSVDLSAGTLYHQTNPNAQRAIRKQGFRLDTARNRGSDREMPDGVFLKFNDAPLKMGGSQIPVMVMSTKPLRVQDRAELLRWLEANSPAYTRLRNEAEQSDRDYEAQWDAIWNGSDHPDLEDLKRVPREWGPSALDFSARLREQVTKSLHAKGYDSVWMQADEGTQNRTVETLVVLDPHDVVVLK